jgi:hypothetical protein
MSDITNIPDTNYIVLPDNRVARLLKPTVIGDKRFYNFTIKGKYVRLRDDKVAQHFQSANEQDTEAPEVN